jgi:hypothetical protein
MDWDSDHLGMATKVAVERFAMNSVAGHFAPPTIVDKALTQVPANRFDYDKRIVTDNENLNLYVPFATCNFTLSQMTEFGSAKGDAAMQSRAISAITRAASSLARWHDVLFFFGLELDPKTGRGTQQPNGVELGPIGAAPFPRGLRQAATDAEAKLGVGPILVGTNPAIQVSEDLVKSVYAAVLKLEERGYYTMYYLVLGETLWEELHRPTQGSLVLPRDRIEPTLLGGTFHRTTTLPKDEAVLASLDGPTLDCVIAADANGQPSFEVLPTKVDNQTVYQARIVETFAPRVRENQAVIRLQIDPRRPPDPAPKP